MNITKQRLDEIEAWVNSRWAGSNVNLSVDAAIVKELLGTPDTKQEAPVVNVDHMQTAMELHYLFSVGQLHTPIWIQRGRDRFLVTDAHQFGLGMIFALDFNT